MAVRDNQPLATPDTIQVRAQAGLQFTRAHTKDSRHVAIVTTSAANVNSMRRCTPGGG